MTATTTIKLKKSATFTRQHEGETLKMDLPAGKTVCYRRDDTATEFVHIATYEDGDHNVWTNVVRCPKPSTPVVKPAPVNATITTAVEKTGTVAAYAVKAVTSRTVSVAGADADEVRVRRMAAMADALRGDVYQVNYYIPTALSETVDNPSRIFRRHGFRLDGSNWVFPQHGLNHSDVQAVLREWDSLVPTETASSLPGFTSRTQVRYWVIKYTKEQLAQMWELAQSQLAEELQKTHRSLIERIDNASKDVQTAREEAATHRERDKADNAYNGRLRATVTEACERFEMCLKGAEIFDDTGSLDALFGAVRDAIRTQALAVNTLLESRGVKTVNVPASIG